MREKKGREKRKRIKESAGEVNYKGLYMYYVLYIL